MNLYLGNSCGCLKLCFLRIIQEEGNFINGRSPWQKKSESNFNIHNLKVYRRSNENKEEVNIDIKGRQLGLKGRLKMKENG